MNQGGPHCILGLLSAFTYVLVASGSSVTSAMSWEEAPFETISSADVSYQCVLDNEFGMCVPDAFCVV